jgi:hypothetical protein
MKMSTKSRALKLCRHNFLVAKIFDKLNITNARMVAATAIFDKLNITNARMVAATAIFVKQKKLSQLSR